MGPLDPQPRSGLTALGLPWNPPSNPAHQTSDWAHRTGRWKMPKSFKKDKKKGSFLDQSLPAGYHWVCHMAYSNHDLWNCWSQSCSGVNHGKPNAVHHPQNQHFYGLYNPQTPVMPHSFWPNQSHHAGTWLWARSLWELQWPLWHRSTGLVKPIESSVVHTKIAGTYGCSDVHPF